MAVNSSIEWTESTWNPLTGCTKISPGCKHCYAERLSKRLQAIGQTNYKNGFRLTLHEQSLSIPLQWKKPQMIFVNSMSDLFHEDVPIDFIKKVFYIMNKASWHIFQVLTKRSTRLLELNDQISWSQNIWMGVSVENNDYIYRIDHLRKTNAKTKFISLEPLLGPLPDINLDGIDWIIVGGESGPGARKMDISWVRDIRDQSLQNDIPFFFKQWGGINKKKTGRILDGQTWDTLPKKYNSKLQNTNSII
jgi:protein gp37